MFTGLTFDRMRISKGRKTEIYEHPVIALAKEKLEMETRRLAAIREGDLRPHWLDDALRKAGMLADGETL